MRRTTDHYRLPEALVRYSCSDEPTEPQGYFTWGEGSACFGSCSSVDLKSAFDAALPDVRSLVATRIRAWEFPFNPDHLIENLLFERYPTNGPKPWITTPFANAYYQLRPLL